MSRGPGVTARGFVVALVGAECTGKSTLATRLCTALRAQGRDVAVVCETLREFTALHGRTPRRAEQAAIAAEQTRRIEAAASAHALVIADTTALMTAVYSAELFGDDGLVEAGVSAQRRCDLTLLAAPDLPWQGDGVQRDGAQARAAVDARLRELLRCHGIGFSVVPGTGDARLQAALAAIDRACHPP